MIHEFRTPRRRSLGALALAACLSSSAFAAAPAQRKSAPQKKKPEKVKPGTDLLPGVEAPAGDPQATKLPPSILVRWQGKPGVNRYRLQLATDERFEDIVFDQAVEGRQHVIKDLPPGNYFWRVAPAAAETSNAYSRPEPVTMGGGQKVAESSVVMPADATGWR
ncbi:MAG TPA: hypothetical protein VGB98_19600, partial [Pyrinomonadaceae bacterium]